MQESFDPYVVWLGFPPGQTPKNYYELFGLPLFETDLEKITRAADTLRGQVRQIRPGAYLAQWQQLLDQLNAAKRCLLDPVAKSAYDASLRQGVQPGLGGSSDPLCSSRTPGGTSPAPSGGGSLGEVPPGLYSGPSGPEGPDPGQPSPPRDTLPTDASPPGYGSESRPVGPGGAIPSGVSPVLGESPPGGPPLGPIPGGSMTPPPGYSYAPSPESPLPPSTPSPSTPSSSYPGLPNSAIYPNYPNYPNLPTQPGLNGTGFPPPGGEGAGMPGVAYPPPGGMPPLPVASPVPPGYSPLPYGGQTGVGSSYPMPPGAGTPPANALQGGWGPGQVGMPSTPPGTPFAVPVGIPPGGGYSYPTETLVPPRPGEKTTLAKKAALGTRRSVGRMVVICVLLLAVGGILFSLLNRVRTEGPEAILGKDSLPKTSVPGEKNSAHPEGEPSVKPSNGNAQSKEKMSPKRPPAEKEKTSISKEPLGPPGSSGPHSPVEKPLQPKESSGSDNSTTPGGDCPEPEEKTPPLPAPKPSLDPAKQAAWRKAVGEVREALAQHDPASAAEHLKVAEANAQTPEQHDEVERLRMLQHYLDQFWQGIRQSVSSLKGAEEFVVGNIRFIIVEGNSQQLVVRAEGKNLRWPIEKIPGSVVELLAKRWFQRNDPPTKLAWGAYYAVKGNTQRARELWNEAGKAGIDVSALLEELSCWPLPEAAESPTSKSPLQ